MGLFSSSSPPGTCEPCQKCKKRFDDRKQLIQAARDKAKKEPGPAADAALATAKRFETYNQGMPRAKAAQAVYEPDKKVECLTRITDPKELAKLGLKPEDLRDDATGFHAEVYRSEWDGKTILTFQGTDPNSLNDWKANVENGTAADTAQYKEARILAGKMQASGAPFEIAGHSLGGGLAQEAGLVAGDKQVTTFNAAGLSQAALTRTGNGSFASLDQRTTAFRSERDFLTGIQEARDPATQLANAEQLSREIRGTAGTINPMKIKGYNVESNDTPGFTTARDQFFGSVDEMIGKARADVAAGRDPGLFPAAHGQHVDVPGMTWMSNRLNDRLGRLNQHTMDPVITRMEAVKKEDQKALEKYTAKPWW